MNNANLKVLKMLCDNNYSNQREIAQKSNLSLGLVNSIINDLKDEKYIDENMNITDKTKKELKNNTPKNAIILAAGYGMRMVPINLEIPKGLLKVKEEPLIERTIKQLNEVGVTEIYIVVGFMKECYEYLTDKYNVKLIYNSEYSAKNNLHSLSKAVNYLSNTYIIPCDVWCKNNPFSKNELYSWYMVGENQNDEESYLRVNKKLELVYDSSLENNNKMFEIAYLTKNDTDKLKNKVNEMILNKKYNNSFWEDALIEKGKMAISANVVSNNEVYEINTYEELRELDSNSNDLNNEAIKIITDVFKVTKEEIVNITVLKKGLTNRSFLFECKNEKYIMRIPGEGTDQIINRKNEAKVYELINNKNISDDVIYINSNNGYKITKYIENSRACDPYSVEDLEKCIKKVRDFHNLKLKVDNEFDIWNEIDYYEKLLNGKPSVYMDYNQTKNNLLSLKKFVNENKKENYLTHLDVNQDNFLISENDVRLIDWEYAGMYDQDFDIALFVTYALYDREWIDKFIDIYYENKCDIKNRIKIYCYIALCGLYFSNWCEYKSSLGIEFGELSLAEYKYAKDYYKIAIEEMEKLK